jgi:hypothetical protein
VTVREGTNRLVASTRRDLLRAFRAAWGGHRDPCAIEYWDGHAGERISRIVVEQGCGVHDTAG